MLPLRPADDDHTLHQQMTDLNDAQLSDLIAAADAAEVISKAKSIDMGAAALWYAAKLSWPVFPLKPRGKKPLTAHGFKDASTDAAQVREWWTATPEANIGIPTGANGCGYDVIDVDGPIGVLSWAAIKHANCPDGCCDSAFCPAPGPFDIQAVAFTPGNGIDRKPGRHFYVPATGEGNAAGLAAGIDWRGGGGYVVAPPSVGLNGARYAWLTRPVKG